MPANPRPPKGTAKRARAKRTKARKARQYGRDERGDYAAHVRSHPCLGRTYFGGECEGAIEACHLLGRNAHPGASGVGNLWPGCSYHHLHQHRIPLAARQAAAKRLAQGWPA